MIHVCLKAMLAPTTTSSSVTPVFEVTKLQSGDLRGEKISNSIQSEY